MNIFFYTSAQKPEDVKLAKRFVKVLRDSGVDPISNLYAAQHHKDLHRSFFEGIDALIIDAVQEDSRIGYLIASAIARKISVLYMMRKGQALDEYLQSLFKQLSGAKKYVKVEYYTEKTFEKILYTFLDHVGSSIESRGVPSIKFTLRITPYIDHYLNWKSETEGVTKANFLRDKIVDEFISKDKDFEAYLKKQNKNSQ